MSKPAIFLDRDGTIFIDTGYPGDEDPINFLPGVPDSLRMLQVNFVLIIISNQSGVGRGVITKDEMYRVHSKMINKLEEENIRITDSFFCLHAPSDNCICRKPLPTMILNAAEKWNLQLNHSYMIGDKNSDIEAGYHAGCKSILLNDDVSLAEKLTQQPYPDFIASGLQTAANWIMINKDESVT